MTKVIHSYRPQRTAPEDLEAIFVGREPLLKDILARLTRWQPRASRQHYLIIGPRGIGKTNLLRLIEHRIRQTPKLNKKWHPVSIAEDAYGITRVTDLLIEALRILAEDTGEESIKRVYERVKFDDNEARVTDLSLDAFRRFHKSKGCGILLMVENVNRVFERQMHLKSEIHLLRKILIEEDWIITICTSPTYLNAVTQPEEPLFEFFYLKVLSELTPEQQEQMLQKLAALEGNVAFENDVTKFRPQLRALYHFTGGNPRLTILLYDLVANQSITDVKTELDLLLDQLTPFYQDRMKEIAEQERKILETMALLPEGCTPTELAKEARMPGEHVRALLTRLEKAGYIRREERRRKRTIYIIPERFFRIWHQMNHSRAARERVQYLLEFFENWYATNEERERVPEKSAHDLNQVLTTLIEELTDGPQERVEVAIRTLLRSAFRSANLEMIRKTINIVAAHFSDAEAFYAPYVTTLEYIQSDRDPAILERQHPEMRDAIQLLVDIFDESCTHLQQSKQKRLAKSK
ncbi:ATP-binding protein [candidate division KSB1 bacterium]|nr:ATP-binding protein [candidate division KSB1 bacterium]